MASQEEEGDSRSPPAKNRGAPHKYWRIIDHLLSGQEGSFSVSQSESQQGPLTAAQPLSWSVSGLPQNCEMETAKKPPTCRSPSRSGSQKAGANATAARKTLRKRTKYFRGRVWVRPLFSELYFVLTTPLAPIAHDFGIASRVELVEAGSATQVCVRPKNAAPAQCAHPYLKSSPTPRKSTPLHRCQLSINCNFLVT